MTLNLRFSMKFHACYSTCSDPIVYWDCTCDYLLQVNLILKSTKSFPDNSLSLSLSHTHTFFFFKNKWEFCFWWHPSLGAGKYELRASHPDLKVEVRGSTEVFCFFFHFVHTSSISRYSSSFLSLSLSHNNNKNNNNNQSLVPKFGLSNESSTDKSVCH